MNEPPRKPCAVCEGMFRYLMPVMTDTGEEQLCSKCYIQWHRDNGNDNENSET